MKSKIYALHSFKFSGMRKKLFVPACLLALMAFTSIGDKDKGKEKKGWDVNDPPGKYTETEFTVNEGTWMSLDVSPDGKEIVFDLLGDIYSMPISGGEAKLLRGGLALEVQPRYSPDGTKISFTSDAGGGDNIWMMNKDGSNAKQITKESFRLLNNAVWMPNGNYIVARKHFTSTRSLGAGEIWMYHTSGGEGIQLTKRKNDQQDVGEPCASTDGKYIYFSEDMYPGGYFQYNKDPNSQVYVIKRYNTEKGELETVTGGSGGAQRPQVSKDGKTLAFVRRVREKSVLYLRNMETGEEWPVYDKLTKDQQEAWAIFGVYPNFQWLNDNTIVIWAQGKIWKVDLKSSNATEIPFTAKCKHKIHEALKFKQEVAPDKFTVKTIRHAVTSPDEKTVIFNAAGYLWKKELPNGTPQRLTNGTDLEFEPCFSPDGKEIVYVTWSDEGSGAILKMNLTDKKVEKLTPEKGIYRTPRYSPDGNMLVYQKESGNDAQGNDFCVNPGIYCMPSKKGLNGLPYNWFIIKEGENPRFNKEGTRIFYQSSEGENAVYKSCNPKGLEVRTHFTSKYTNDFVPSPDNNWLPTKNFSKCTSLLSPKAARPLIFPQV